MSILEVHDVSIRYMTGDFKDIGLKEYVTRKIKGDYHVNEFWADKNISFTLEKGDMLGIIGTNGAGKSTLLKAVSGIMEPTGGYVRREGNIAALLELASGFDGDLTVRENAYLRGAMLGYTRRFMDEKYDEIIDFAELRDFQDRPFKQLSSGMKSRLAFSIASLVAPDILILDEVLSVGDGAFRKKSEEKMREIIAGGATTILVSHSIQQVRELCNKVLWLEKGRQIAFGDNVEEICDRYQQYLDGAKKREVKVDESPSTALVLAQEVKENKNRQVEPEEKHKKENGTPSAAAQKINLMGNPLLTAIILAELFVMFLMSFPRLDDLTWGSSIGIDRLSTCFAGYNGRYIGNIIVIILTRLPAGIRACVEISVLCMLLYYAYRLLASRGAFCFFVLASLGLPLQVYAQSLVWTAGFANYTTSAVIMLIIMNFYCDVVIKDKAPTPKAVAVFAAVCFLGQLILENTTVYAVVLAGGFLLFGLVKKKKWYVPVAIGLGASACGAILMFSNTAYKSALTGDGGSYKSLAMMPLELWKKYQNEVVPHLVQNNHILNLVLTIVLVLLWYTKSAGMKERRDTPGDKFWGLCGVGLFAFFFYDLVDNTWTQALPHGKSIYALITLMYAFYIIVTIAVAITDKTEKATLLIFAASQVILAAPLVPASPLNARCFFQNGILWAMLIGHMVQVLCERSAAIPDRKAAAVRLVAFTQVVCAGYLLFVLAGQSLSWKIQRVREEITQSGIDSEAEVIVLPEVPWSGIYCYGANISNSNDYWLSNYKRYYRLPNEIKLEFMDFYKWAEKCDYH